MLLTADLIITGAKASKGEFNGKPFDSTKVYAQTTLQSGERSAGSVAAEYTWGLSTNFDKIEKLSYPFKAKGTIQIVSNGKDSKTILLDLIPEQVK